MYAFVCLLLISSAAALGRDEPNTKNTAPFDLVVLLSRQYPDQSIAALDSLSQELQVSTFVDEIKKLIFEKVKEDFPDLVSKLPSPLPSVPPFVKTMKLGCKICTAASRGMKNFINKNGNYSLFENTIIKSCHILFNRTNIQTNIFCDGLIKLQLPYIWQVISSLGLLDMGKFCPYLNACVHPKSTKTMSKVTEQKIGVLKSTPTSMEEPLRVVQLTDIHLEQSYKEESNTDCGLPVCCLEKYGNGTAGYFGDYKCNIPLRTIQSFLIKVKEMNPDIILYSGDTPPHTIWDETFDSQLSCARVLTDMIASTMPATIVYPSVGNHETYPTNLFSYKSLNYTKNFTELFYSYWNPVAQFPDSQKSNILNGGFYTTSLIKDKLRLIVLNSNYWYAFNWFSILNDLKNKEISNMLNFLETELQNAKSAGEKVILMSHHVPGNADYIIKFSEMLVQKILKYSDIITLIPAGHTHLDEFRMIYDDMGVAKAVVLVSPSVTTINFRNPSMRIFKLDRNTFQLLDYDQYYLDLAKMNDYVINNGPIDNITNYITLLYSAKSTYNLADLSPASWDDLTTRLETDHDLLLKHASYSTAEGDTDNSICLSRCVQRYVCRLRNSNFDDFQACLPPVPTIPPNFTLPHFTVPHFKLPGIADKTFLPPNDAAYLRLSLFNFIFAWFLFIF